MINLWLPLNKPALIINQNKHGSINTFYWKH